jgi:hypothetical protein
MRRIKAGWAHRAQEVAVRILYHAMFATSMMPYIAPLTGHTVCAVSSQLAEAHCVDQAMFS